MCCDRLAYSPRLRCDGCRVQFITMTHSPKPSGDAAALPDAIWLTVSHISSARRSLKPLVIVVEILSRSSKGLDGGSLSGSWPRWSEDLPCKLSGCCSSLIAVQVWDWGKLSLLLCWSLPTAFYMGLQLARSSSRAQTPGLGELKVQALCTAQVRCSILRPHVVWSRPARQCMDARQCMSSPIWCGLSRVQHALINWMCLKVAAMRSVSHGAI